MQGSILTTQGEKSPMPTCLKERAVAEVSGPETRGFLQSLLTNDIAAMGRGDALWAGLLTPQGKILFDFFVFDVGGERFLLDVSAAQREPLLQRMGMYRLRRKVDIAPRDDLAVVDGELPDAVAAHADPRFGDMGMRSIATREAAAGLPDDAAEYHARRIALGLPDTDADIGTGRLFPHEANFDQLGGVSFTKGCYVGQEVVSRMQHRSTTRNRLLPVAGRGALETGMEITGAGRRVGEIFSTAGERGMALVRLDRAAAAIEAGEPLMAGDVAIRLERPEWAEFDVPGA